MYGKETENCKFMTPTPREDHLGVNSVKLMYLVHYSWAYNIQTENIIMNAKKGSTKIIPDFMTPRKGIVVLWRVHISHMVKIHYFFVKIVFSAPRHRSDKLSI